MTVEEASKILKMLLGFLKGEIEPPSPKTIEEAEKFEKEGYECLSMAIRSFGAWENVKEELKRQIDHNLEVREKFLVGSYTRIECQVTCTVLADVTNIIDKHLEEVENGT